MGHSQQVGLIAWHETVDVLPMSEAKRRETESGLVAKIFSSRR